MSAPTPTTTLVALAVVLRSEIADRVAAERWYRSPEARRLVMASRSPETWGELRAENLLILRNLLRVHVRAHRAERRTARGRIGWVA